MKAPPSAIPPPRPPVPTAYVASANPQHPTITIVYPQTVTPRPTRSPVVRLEHRVRMFCCCLCCPAYKCAIITALLELVLALYFWWDAFNHVAKSWNHSLQLKDVLILLFLTGFIVAASTAAGTLIAAKRKKTPHFVWPRLVLLGGILITCGVTFFLLFIYFNGGSQGINNFIFNVMEFVLQQDFTHDDRKGLHGDMHTAAIIFTLLLLLFTLYTTFGFCATRKFYHDLLQDYRNFLPVGQEPSAPPQPAFNPEFKA